MIQKLLAPVFLLPFLTAFLGLNIFLQVDGGGNPASRLAALASFVEEGSYQINTYVAQINPEKNWTADWSQGPDGNYYSNKAPGGFFVALPFYYVWDRIVFRQDTREARDEARFQKYELSSYFLSFVTQILPFAVLLLLFSNFLLSKGYSENSVKVLWLLLGFANTNALLMNTFFGHGVTAVFMLATCMSFFMIHDLKKRYFFVGLGFGFALLSDYGTTFALPGLLLWMYWDFKNAQLPFLKIILAFICGGILPGLLWVQYHYSCFGSPFAISLNYQNPVFATEGVEPESLSRVIGLIPQIHYVKRLLWGSARGLLMTQPWIFLVFIFGVLAFLNLFKPLAKPQMKKEVFVVSALIFFIGIFWMNSSFGVWWGGAGPGPRYLGPALTPMALSAFFIYSGAAKKQKLAFLILILPAMLLFSLSLSQKILVDNTPLWRDLGYQLVGMGKYSNGRNYWNIAKYFISTVLMLLLFFNCYSSFRKEVTNS